MFLGISIEGWITFGIAFIGMIIGIVKVHTKSQSDLNRQGEKVNTLISDNTTNRTLINSCMGAITLNTETMTQMRERISANETKITALQNDLQEERLAVMSKLHEIDRDASKRDSDILSSIARLDERLNIADRLITSFEHIIERRNHGS